MDAVAVEVVQEVTADKSGVAGNEVFFHVFPCPVNSAPDPAAGLVFEGKRGRRGPTESS
jgi:hypothetical protein